MEQRFIEYLTAIQIEEPVRLRVETVIDVFRRIYPDRNIDDIFVSQQDAGAGQFPPDTLVLFSEGLVFQAQRFPYEDVYQAFGIREGLSYWELRRRDYDLDGKASGLSRLAITFVPMMSQAGPMDPAILLKAMGRNCDYLLDVFTKHIVPNLIEYQLDILREIRDRIPNNLGVQ